MKMFIKGWTGVFTAVGILGGTPEGAVSSVSTITTTTTNPVEHVRATRRAQAPGGKPPVVKVGGGGRGAPMKGPNVPGAVVMDSAQTVSEQVGTIIDESGEGEVPIVDASPKEMEMDNIESEDEPASDDQPNPKKRMWEEETGENKKREAKDEL
jgi:protein transport protein SEC20